MFSLTLTLELLHIAAVIFNSLFKIGKINIEMLFGWKTEDEERSSIYIHSLCQGSQTFLGQGPLQERTFSKDPLLIATPIKHAFYPFQFQSC